MRLFFAILGHPVSHSLSPRFQQAAFDALGIDASYLPFDLPPERLQKGLEALRTLNVSGFNITLPHKEAMLGCVDTATQTASEIGAVNTVISTEGRWLGENTDGPGFLLALDRFLEENRLPFPTHALLFGAGGSARSVLWALSKRPVTHLLMVNRTLSRGKELLKLPFLSTIRTRMAADLTDPALGNWLSDSPGALLINTLSLHAFQGRSVPFPPLEGLPLSGHLLFDLSYASKESGTAGGLTPFLHMGTPYRTPRQNGLGMLLFQGALAFEKWTGRKAPVEKMESVLRDATGQDSLWRSV